MSTPNTSLIIPRPSPGLAPFEIDLSIAYEAEPFLRELATAGSGSAMSLVSIFGRAYCSLGRTYAQVYQEVGLATVASRKRKAQIVLDIVPQVLKDKGLSEGRGKSGGNSDLRDAVCYSDQQYCAIENYRASLEAAKELILIKLQSFKLAAYAAQSIAKGSMSSAGNGIYDVSISQDTIMDEACIGIEKARPVTSTSVSTVKGFGRPSA